MERKIRFTKKVLDRTIIESNGNLVKKGDKTDFKDKFMPDRYKHLEKEYKRGRKEDCKRFDEFSKVLRRDNISKKLDGLLKLTRIIKGIDKIELVKSGSAERNLRAYKISVAQDEMWVEIKNQNWVYIPLWLDMIYELELDGEIMAHNTLVHVRIAIPYRYNDTEGNLRGRHMESLGLEPLFMVR